MKITTLKWFLIFIYLVITLPVGIFIAAIATQVFDKIILCFFSWVIFRFVNY